MKPITRELCMSVLPPLRNAVRHQVAMWEALSKMEKVLGCEVESHHLQVVSVEGMENFSAIGVDDARGFLESLREDVTDPVIKLLAADPNKEQVAADPRNEQVILFIEVFHKMIFAVRCKVKQPLWTLGISPKSWKSLSPSSLDFCAEDHRFLTEDRELSPSERDAILAKYPLPDEFFQASPREEGVNGGGRP